jgi:hypothetical protein
MAGEKRRRGKQSVEQAEHRGGDERGPKIRKVTQEEMGKRKGKLQIKDRDKPTELEKVRPLEEKGEKKAVPDDAEADFATRMTEKKAAFYKKIVEEDCGYLLYTEKAAKYYPGGPAAAMARNEATRQMVKEFKAHAARRLKEYNATGCLEYYPPDGKLPPNFLNRLISNM